jgi:hypothetical protein
MMRAHAPDHFGRIIPEKLQPGMETQEGDWGNCPIQDPPTYPGPNNFASFRLSLLPLLSMVR